MSSVKFSRILLSTLPQATKNPGWRAGVLCGKKQGESMSVIFLLDIIYIVKHFVKQQQHQQQYGGKYAHGITPDP
jgi:hypothetical protein